jgi:hypothetical protein
MRNTNTKTLGKSLAKAAVETNLIPDRLIREKLLVPTDEHRSDITAARN